MLHVDGVNVCQVTAKLPELSNGNLGGRQLGEAVICGWTHREVAERGKVGFCAASGFL